MLSEYAAAQPEGDPGGGRHNFKATWADEAEAAFIRGNSPFRFGDLFTRLRQGKARMWVSGDLHGSVFFYDDGSVEVGHMAGKWVDDDARWIIKRMSEQLRELGHDSVDIEGRAGWQRFLKMKGILQ